MESLDPNVVASLPHGDQKEDNVALSRTHEEFVAGEMKSRNYDWERLRRSFAHRHETKKYWELTVLI